MILPGSVLDVDWAGADAAAGGVGTRDLPSLSQPVTRIEMCKTKKNEGIGRTASYLRRVMTDIILQPFVGSLAIPGVS